MHSYESLDYKEHFILTADLDTLLPASSPSPKLAPADVQAAVTEALLAEEDGVADSPDPLDVRMFFSFVEWIGCGGCD